VKKSSTSSKVFPDIGAAQPGQVRFGKPGGHGLDMPSADAQVYYRQACSTAADGLSAAVLLAVNDV
jgi:hypothetical protein